MAFSNIGGDATNEAFSDGMSEELITNLGKVGGLSVVARSSAFSFKGKPLSAPELGSKLRVRYLVEGSVRWAGDRLRVNAQLIDAATGKLLWSDEYDRHPRDVFAVQDEITKAIVGQLRLKLSPAASASIAKHPTESTEAHNLYLLGRFFFAKRDSASLRKAQDYFERAIRVDSSYALAYAGLSDAYSHRSVFGYAAPRDVLPQARTAALKALSLDSTLVEARTSLGFILLFFEWNWAAAGRELDTALAIDPNYSPAHLYHAWYFVASGKPRDAVNEGREAVRLEPLYLINNTRLADFLYFARRYDEAVVQAKSVLELEPAFFQGRAALARAYSQLGRCDQAVRALDERPEETPWFRGIAGQVYARCGRRAQALSELERLRAEARQGLSFSHHAVAVIDAALGEKDEAFAQLDSAYAAHDWHMFTIMGDAAWDQLRADPRFAQLTRKIGLTP
jgi:serine/threonine-protein kinase